MNQKDLNTDKCETCLKEIKTKKASIKTYTAKGLWITEVLNMCKECIDAEDAELYQEDQKKKKGFKWQKKQ